MDNLRVLAVKAWGRATPLGEFVKILTERLTKRDCEKVILGLAGLPSLLPKLRESHESSPRLFRTLTLEPLEPQESIEVIMKGLEDANKRNSEMTEIDSDAAELIANISEGYPHFIQQFAYCAFDCDTDGRIDRDDVAKGAFGENGAIVQLGHQYFYELYYDQIASDDYRKVLAAMAVKFDSWSTRAEILSISKVKEYTLNNALKALKNRNIILVNERQKGQYRLPTKSFAVWINALESKRKNTK